jgi:7-cyano-7-deazaguanine reductase
MNFEKPPHASTDAQKGDLNFSPLGKNSQYPQQYNADLLFPIPRSLKRKEIGILAELPFPELPFQGYDLWNAYEVSWLNLKGKPVVAVGEWIIPCDSPNLIESKSLKLYLNSFNHSQFESSEQVSAKIIHDLSIACGQVVRGKLFSLKQAPFQVAELRGLCLDELDIECQKYQPDADLLSVKDVQVEETVYSHLLKSNCPVTGQPDWGTLQIRYSGLQINHEGLLRYIVSFRDHNEFHEQCVEKIFLDVLHYCKPEQLAVYARYTRRGGLDINPYRANYPFSDIENRRLIRQ